MKKIIIGDHTYDIPDKVHILIEDLTDKNTRLRTRAKRAYGEGWEDGARLGTYDGEGDKMKTIDGTTVEHGMTVYHPFHGPMVIEIVAYKETAGGTHVYSDPSDCYSQEEDCPRKMNW